LALEKFSRR